PVAARQRRRFTLPPAAPDRTHGVDHVAGGEEAGGGDDRLPLRQRTLALPDPLALLEDGGSATAVDGAVHAAPAHQARVGGVDDGVHRLSREVALRQLEAGAAEAAAHENDAARRFSGAPFINAR